ncbi:MAG TPA: hypothetical protein VGQ55_02690, partial [Pyrinomonadaceae bacterium]|nr:hypothetical protein [Pyrinomonadaceae bacterium]
KCGVRSAECGMEDVLHDPHVPCDPWYPVSKYIDHGRHRTHGTKIRVWRLAALFLLMVAATAGLACKPDQRILNSAATPPPATVPVAESTPSTSTIKQDVETMRNADFNFIYVFRRKNGGPIDADDRRFAGAITPPEINRRKLSDGGKAIILGSNFRLPPDVMKKMTDRFALQDLSKPASELPGANSNTNK